MLSTLLNTGSDSTTLQIVSYASRDELERYGGGKYEYTTPTLKQISHTVISAAEKTKNKSQIQGKTNNIVKNWANVIT